MNKIIVYVYRCDQGVNISASLFLTGLLHPQCTKMCVGNFDHIFPSPNNVKPNKIGRTMKGLVLEEIISCNSDIINQRIRLFGGNFNINWESERMNWCGGQHYNLCLF